MTFALVMAAVLGFLSVVAVAEMYRAAPEYNSEGCGDGWGVRVCGMARLVGGTNAMDGKYTTLLVRRVGDDGVIDCWAFVWSDPEELFEYIYDLRAEGEISARDELMVRRMVRMQLFQRTVMRSERHG